MSTVDPIRVEGLTRFKNALRALGPDAAKALRVALNKAVEAIADDARRKVPTRTGKARASIRAASSQTAARVQAGGRKAPYFPWLDFGGRVGIRRSVKRSWRPEGRYLYVAYKQNRDDLVIGIEHAVSAAARDAGLTVG